MTFARRPQGVLSRIVPDRRRHKRIAVTLLGPLHAREQGGAPLQARRHLRRRRRGDVSRRRCPWASAWSPTSTTSAASKAWSCASSTAALPSSIEATQHKREKLAAQLTWLANRSELGEDGPPPRAHRAEQRRADRCSWPKASRSPAACSTSRSPAPRSPRPARPEIGTEVMLGKLRARVVRHHPQGFGVQFLDIQNPTALRRYFG